MMTKDKISKSLIVSSLSPCRIEGFFIFKKCPSHGAENLHLRAEPSTVMAAPEPHIAVRFYSTRNHLVWQVSIHAKTGNIAGSRFKHLTKLQNRFILKIQRVLPMNGQPSVYFKEIEPILLDKGRFISFYVCDYETVRSAL